MSTAVTALNRAYYNLSRVYYNEVGGRWRIGNDKGNWRLPMMRANFVPLEKIAPRVRHARITQYNDISAAVTIFA